MILGKKLISVEGQVLLFPAFNPTVGQVTFEAWHILCEMNRKRENPSPHCTTCMKALIKHDYLILSSLKQNEQPEFCYICKDKLL